MREKFKGYYRPTQSEENDMWASAYIVMDTNVVLDLYKYHTKTTDLYLRSLEKFKAQLWLPYQVALEFHRNRPKVRAETTKGHKDRIKDLEGIRNKIQQNTPKSKLASSKVEQELIAKTDEAIDALRHELKQLSDETHVNSQDKLLDRITELFDGRVGDAPAPARLEELHKEAEKRFDKSIPPGYEDRKTKAPGEEYGDYLLWRQVMDYAKEHQKNIIIATEDKKSDWWQKLNGDEIVGPRPELIQEFRSETGQEIIFYSGRDFFQQLSDRAQISESTDDLAGALADVASVSDERSAALAAAYEFAAEDLRLRRESIIDDSLTRFIGTDEWTTRTLEEEDEGRALRARLHDLSTKENLLRGRIMASERALKETEEDESRSAVENRTSSLRQRLEDLQAQREALTRRLYELDAANERDWARKVSRGKRWLDRRLQAEESLDE